MPKSAEERGREELVFVSETVSAALKETFEPAMEIFRCFNGAEKATEYFYVRGIRGGFGHCFSSDELKRTCANAIRNGTTLKGARKQCADLKMRSQIHNRSFWFGLCLNAGAPLGQGIKKRVRKKKKQREPESLFDWRPNDYSPGNVHDAVSPLAKMPYKEQLRRKAEDMTRVASTLGIPTPVHVVPSVPADYYRNKVDFVVGRDSDGRIEVGFKLPSGCGVVSPMGTKIISEEMVLLSRKFRTFLEESSMQVAEHQDLKRRKNDSRRAGGQTSNVSSRNVGVWSGLNFECDQLHGYRARR